MTNIIVTTFLVLAALSWFTFRSDDVSKNSAPPARVALSAAPAMKYAIPAPRVPEARTPLGRASRPALSGEGCDALAREFAAIDFQAIGKIASDLRMVVDSPTSLVEGINGMQARNACNPADEELRKLLADLKKDCASAVDDTFEHSLWREWCFQDFVKARYRLTEHMLRDTPLDAIDDPETLKNLYFGLQERPLPDYAKGEHADGKEDLVITRMLEVNPQDRFAAEQRLSRDLGTTHGHAIGVDLHALFPDADREIEGSIARLEAIDPESPYARAARLTLAIDHDDFDGVERLVDSAPADSAIGPYYRAWLTYRRGDIDGAKSELSALKLRESASVPGGPTWEISTALRNLEEGTYEKEPRDVFPPWHAPLGHSIVEPLAMVTPGP